MQTCFEEIERRTARLVPRPAPLRVPAQYRDLDGDGKQNAAVWIVKEQLRSLLALRATKTHIAPAPARSVTSSPPSTVETRTTSTSPSRKPSRTR